MPKVKQKPIKQGTCARYTVARLNLECGSGAGGYALTCQALAVDGLPKPLGISAKAWVFQNAAHIRAAAEKLPPKKKAGSRPRRTYYPPVPVVHSGADVKSNDFLQTFEWRRVRMLALKKYGPQCQCCGATPASGAVMNVDHIKPRKLFPHLALDVDNLQILCDACNHGKGNWDMTDWRTQAAGEADLEPEQRAHWRAIAV